MASVKALQRRQQPDASNTVERNVAETSCRGSTPPPPTTADETWDQYYKPNLAIIQLL